MQISLEWSLNVDPEIIASKNRVDTNIAVENNSQVYIA